MSVIYTVQKTKILLSCCCSPYFCSSSWSSFERRKFRSMISIGGATRLDSLTFPFNQHGSNAARVYVTSPEEKGRKEDEREKERKKRERLWKRKRGWGVRNPRPAPFTAGPRENRKLPAKSARRACILGERSLLASCGFISVVDRKEREIDQQQLHCLF